jgi:hypothetical protein
VVIPDGGLGSAGTDIAGGGLGSAGTDIAGGGLGSAGTDIAGGGAPPGVEPSERPRKRRLRAWHVLVGALAVAVAVLATVATIASRYQPLSFGGASGGVFPGLPTGAGSGVREVNTFELQRGELYVPPTAGVFTDTESVLNSGPRAVTIEAVTLSAPSTSPPWPLAPAGRVLYMPETGPGNRTSGRPVHGLSLAPNQDVFIGMPVMPTYRCYATGKWTTLSYFYVEERSSVFVRWAAIPLPVPILMHEPVPKSTSPGTECPGR